MEASRQVRKKEQGAPETGFLGMKNGGRGVAQGGGYPNNRYQWFAPSLYESILFIFESAYFENGLFGLRT